eukprot:8062746-Pyramimonas_sp.AAC.1
MVDNLRAPTAATSASQRASLGKASMARRAACVSFWAISTATCTATQNSVSFGRASSATGRVFRRCGTSLPDYARPE